MDTYTNDDIIHYLQQYDGIAYLKDAGLRPLFLFGTVEYITGRSPEDFTGGTVEWYGIVHPDDLPVVIEEDTRLRTVPHYAVNRQYRIRHANGTERHIREIARHIPGNTAEEARIHGSIFDITTLREPVQPPPLTRPDAFGEIITRNRTMLTLFGYMERIAPSRRPVLITGETGVGKELVARAFHRLGGDETPFVTVNAAGLDDTMFADTLFGHTPGAFTGAGDVRGGLVERAAGGILFLDEIGDLRPESQVKLLRLIQEGEYFPLGSDTLRTADVRIIVATNKNIDELEAEGSFRTDLYYRLNTHHVNIPPLRERPEDIKPLVEHFLGRAAEDLGIAKPSYPGELLTLLATYSFPGNIRELESLVYDAVSQHGSGVIPLETFSRYIHEKNSRLNAQAAETDEPLPGCIVIPKSNPTLKDATTHVIRETLRRTGGNQTIAARYLGISRQALNRRLRNMET